jgi:hypothetical protein
MTGLRRRRLLFVVLGAVGMLACGLFAWLQLPRPGVTRANYQRLREGMTLREVEGLFGMSADKAVAVRPSHPPLGGRVDDKAIEKALEEIGKGPPPHQVEAYWYGSGFFVVLNFDWDGHLYRRGLVEDDKSFLNRFRRLLRL